MKEIDRKFLENVENDYLSNDVYTIARHALTKSKIFEISEVSERSQSFENSFSINIETLPVCNQKQSGRCWIFAGLNVLREAIAKKYNLEDFQLSQSYISFWDKLEKCNYLLEKIISLKGVEKDNRTLDYLLTNGIEDGGQWDLFVNIVNKYGVVPKSAFVESYQSSNTREINEILNRLIRKFAFEIRENVSLDDIKEKKEELLKDIYKVLCSAYGVPPKFFNFEYVNKDKKYNIVKNITPQEFMHNFVQVDLNDYISIINSPTKDKPFNKTYTVKNLGNVIEGNSVKYLNLSIDRLKELAIAQLKNLEPVWFGCDCTKYGMRDIGIWDDKLFDIDTLFQVNSDMSKEAMLDTRESAMNHAMVITGVNLDNNIPNKWKIENSWGDTVGNKGYYIATDTWFDKFVYQVVVNKKYLNDEEKEDLKLKPIELEAWDPMGTLAK